MKYTLLEIVQTILSAMNSDEVNSIGDTVESNQVALVVRSAYDDLLTRTEFPEHNRVFELEASGDPSKQTLMKRPILLDNVEWVRYNNTIGTADDYTLINYLDLNSFLELMYSVSNTHSNSDTLISYKIKDKGNTFSIYGVNNKGPEYYTEIPGVGFIFDSYNKEIDDTLKKDKSVVYGRQSSRFVLEDDFVPLLDAQNFNLLVSEAKALAFAEIKQTVHQKAEASVKRGIVSFHRRKDAAPTSTFHRNLPNYGRK